MEFFTFRYGNRDEEFEDPRRAFLVKALTLGLFATGTRGLWPDGAMAMGERPHQLPPGRSVFRTRGDVRVDGIQATRETQIGPRACIETGSDSELVFVVGRDAFMLREHSTLELFPLAANGGGGGAGEDAVADSIVGTLRLLSGRILNVFGVRGPAQKLSLHTPTATIGVRGTGIYVESRADSSYVCTCYGSTVLRAVGDPSSREDITTTHHDSPRFILADGAEGRRIEPAPVINHTDMELVLLESLVGRKPPFWPLDSGY